MRTRLLWGFLFFAMAAVVAVFVLRQAQHERTSSPVTLSLSKGARPDALDPIAYNQAPAFTLTDQTGKSFSNRDLEGKLWIADFIFTSCAGQCPLMSKRMGQLQSTLPGSIHLVSFSVDPERDTPKVLSVYAKSYGADPKRWHFLTGDKKALSLLVQEGFQLSYAEGGSKTDPIAHSGRFVLVDAKGQIHGYYDSFDEQALEKLKADARRLGS